MHTLHEFFTMTKGVEYLIAVTFLIIFPAFWILLMKKKDDKTKKAHNQQFSRKLSLYLIKLTKENSDGN